MISTLKVILIHSYHCFLFVKYEKHLAKTILLEYNENCTYILSIKDNFNLMNSKHDIKCKMI